MSFMLLGILNAQASGGAGNYWLSTLGGAASDVGYAITIDSDGNSYAVGESKSVGAGTFDQIIIAKYDSAGSVQWQRSFGNNTGATSGFSIAADSSNNIYVLGETRGMSADKKIILAKYDSSGTIQWQKTLGGVGTDTGQSVAIDSSDNVYVLGYTDSLGARDFKFLLAKYNSSGTIQWQRTLAGGFDEFGQSVAIDSSDNVYVLGYTSSTGAGGYDFLLAKYNSSGTIQWQRVLGGTANDFARTVAIDSSDNVYVIGDTRSTGAGDYQFLLAKYNSSGTIQWQKTLGGADTDRGYSVAIDSSDNVYVLGYGNSTGAGAQDLLLAKYNSSGTIQWQRVLGGASNDYGRSLAIDSSDNLYVLGHTNSTGEGSNDFLLAVLPNDGSLTGTYSLDGEDFVYAASSLTAATSTLTASTSSLTAATSSLTAATSSLTSSSASLTSHQVDL